MQKIESSYANSPRLLSAVVATVGFLRIFIFLRMSDAELVKRIPDDAFYYLVPARNFAELGRWTFDGSEPASGFHLMWGYLLALFFRIYPNSSLHLLFAIGTIFQVCCLAVAAGLTAKMAARVFGNGAVPGIALVFLSASCLQQGTWLMESSLVVLASAVILFLLCRPEFVLTPALCIGAVLLGFASMMTRSDAGLLSLVLFIMHLCLWHLKKVDISGPRIAALVLAGGVAGLVVTLLHTHWVSGQWVQSSAQQKMLWSHLQGYSTAPARAIVWSFFNPIFDAAAPFTSNFWSGKLPHAAGALIRVLLTSAIGWAAFQTIRRCLTFFAGGFTLALLAVLLAYIMFYGFDSAALQGWYVGNFVVPVALLTGAASVYYVGSARPAVWAISVGMSIAGFFFSLQASMPWQETMYRAGVYLSQHPQLRPVASFNAGIIGFFAHGGVTNVDGLVNDSILSYAKEGKLAQYFANRHISYLLESPQVFSNYMALRGGYADGKLQKCIATSEDLFPEDPDNIYGGGRIRLYTLDMQCLQLVTQEEKAM